MGLWQNAGQKLMVIETHCGYQGGVWLEMI